MVTHISIDLWNTLIRPNPVYRALRNQVFKRRYGIEAEQLEPVWNRLKDLSSVMALGFGHSVMPKGQLFSSLLTQLGQNPSDWRNVYNELCNLMVRHPPIIEVEALEALFEARKHVTLSITSNAGFVGADALERVVNTWGPDFSFMVFDDWYGVAKPDKKLFEITKLSVNHVHGRNVPPEQIVHVGDHEICDSGALAVGMRCQIIGGYKELPQTLRELTNETY